MRPKLTPEEKAEAIRLQRQCWTQARIAEKLGVSPKTVYRFLSAHNRKALERLLTRTASIKAQQISQLEYMADEAVQEWQRSKLDAETVKTTDQGPRAGDDPSGPVVIETKTETTVKGQTGNPALLNEARAALADVRKILGLDAAHDLATAKLALLTKDDGTPSVKDSLAEAEARDHAFDDEPGDEPAASESTGPGPDPEGV